MPVAVTHALELGWRPYAPAREFFPILPPQGVLASKSGIRYSSSMETPLTAGAAAQAPSSARFAARRDLALVVVVTAVAAILSARLNLSEAVLSWARPHERLQLDELPGVLLVLAVCLAWFSLRRYLEARREIVRRRRIEASLVAALSENRRLTQQYVQMQESERRALARDLHDELGQYLNAVKVDVVSMRDRLTATDANAHRTASETIRNIDHIQSVVMGLIRQLRPVGLDELGLPAAVEYCVDEWRRRLPQTSIGLRMTERLDEGLDEMRRLVIYRLVQEALTNVARHSRATQVEVGITREDAQPHQPARVMVSVEDNGVGASPGRAGEGLGLVGMRERVEAVGGSLSVSNSATGGFVLRGQLPVEAMK
jgi:signal transduction histidine kinase